MSKATSRGRFEVFDFDEEEESVQRESARIMKKFPKPVDASPITKYTFLERFGKETTPPQKRTVVVPVDCESSFSQETKKTGRKGYIDIHSSGCNSCPRSLHPRENPSSTNNVGFTVDKDEGKSTGSNSLLASTSVSTESKSSCEEQYMELDVKSWENDTLNSKVVVSPDSVMHGKVYCTDSILTFTPNTIRLVGSFVVETKEPFCIEWPVTNIIKIDSQWCRDVETAVIKIYFRFEDTAVFSENGSSGVALLKFTVCDSSWFQGEEAIKLLNAKYKSLWNVIYDIESVREENKLLETKSTLDMPEEDSEVLIFPKGEPDAVSVGRGDIELLQPETFINDTIIDFYMKYLMTQIPHEEKNRFYFFNSFFFRKLADLDKDSNNESERKEAFQRVRKWTRNVNLFEKDYIFIPVNFSLHWSLIIICYPGELTNTKDDATDKYSKVTCILHLDSLKGFHKGLKNLFESYLKEELRVRQSVITEALALNVSKIKFCSLEVPQQQNSFDCGLFLLHYVERFLEHVCFRFNPYISLDRDWFSPAEVSCKRSYIRELIHKLLLDFGNDNEGDQGYPHSLSVSPDQDHDKNQPEYGSDIEEACSLTDRCGAKDPSSNDLNFIDSPTKQVESRTKSGLLTPDLPDNIRHTDSVLCSEVAEKFNDRIHSYPDLDSRTVSGKANEPSKSYPSKLNNSLRTSWNTGLSRLQGVNNSRKISFTGSLNSSTAELNDVRPDQPTANLKEELNHSDDHSALVENLEDIVVEDSEDEAVNVAVTGANGGRDRLPSCFQANLLDCVGQDFGREEDLEPMSYEEKDVIDIEDSSKSFKIIDLSNEEDREDRKLPVKKPRLDR